MCMCVVCEYFVHSHYDNYCSKPVFVFTPTPAWAEKRGYYTAKGARLDTYRAGLLIALLDHGNSNNYNNNNNIIHWAYA